MSTVKTIARNTGFLLVSDVGSRILSLVFLIYIARFLGDSGLGKYSFIFAYVGFFTLISDLGIVPLIVREVARDKKKIEFYLHNSITLKIVFTLASLAVAVGILLSFERTPEMVIAVSVAAAAMLFYNLTEACLAVFQAHQKMGVSAFVVLIERLFTAGLGIFALFNGHGLITIVWIYFLGYAVMFFSTLFFAWRNFGKVRMSFDLKAMKEILKESWPFWLTAIFATIYFKTDTVMLRILNGYESVGLYNAAYAILEAFIFIPSVAARAVFPAMSKFFVENREALKILFEKSSYYLLIIGVPVSVGITLLADRIIFLVYGPAFGGSVIALQILIWSVVLIFISTISGNFLNAINLQKRFFYITAFSAFANVALNLFLIPAFGFAGAAATTVITGVFGLMLILYYVKKAGFGFSITKLLAKPAIGGIVMGAAVYYFRQINLFALILLGAIVYFITIFLIKGIKKEDVSYFKQIFAKG